MSCLCIFLDCVADFWRVRHAGLQARLQTLSKIGLSSDSDAQIATQLSDVEKVCRRHAFFDPYMLIMIDQADQADEQSC